ncbi:NfeD family protein [Candidatus Babeliales bacterium]|nr:NfeD family protein [Candidatus Babeliales bacterium]
MIFQPLFQFYINLGYLWLLLAIAFLLVELSTPGLFFFVGFAIGCAVASVMAFMGYSFAIQCIASLIVSILSFGFLKKYFSESVRNSKGEKTNIHALSGQKALVVSAIKPTINGRIKIRGELWPAKVDGTESFENGELVIIVRIEGNHLVVKKLGES